jgi:protein ImuA
MHKFQQDSTLETLRLAVKRLENGEQRPADAVLPFGVPEVDLALPHGGLLLGSLHEITSGTDYTDDAAALMFTAGILARLGGVVLWCIRSRDLFMPGLACAGLNPERVIYAEASDEKALLQTMEEGLHHAGLAGVVGEVKRLSMTAARRLHLAARSSGVTAFTIQRHGRYNKNLQQTEPTAAATRWRITSVPSAPLPVEGIGRERWLVELTRCREGETANWEMGACDATGHLTLSPALVNRPVAATYRALSA